MSTRITKRGLEILRHVSPVALSRPAVRSLVSRLDPGHRRRFAARTLKHRWLNRVRHDAPPGVYETIEIRPREIQRRVRKGDGLKGVRQDGIGRIKGGDWDAPENCVDIADHRFTWGLLERFETGKEWEDTDYYEHLLEHKDEGQIRERTGHETIEEYLSERCRRYDRLFEEIRDGGYRPNHRGSRLVSGQSQPVSSRLEVLVAVDRRGEIHLFEGHHRFAMARALDLTIPAHVVCRHERWQELRDDVFADGLSAANEAELRSHPDLQDVIG